MDTLTKGQREALWQRFRNTRSSLKDLEVERQWGEVAKGKGSVAEAPGGFCERRLAAQEHLVLPASVA